MAERTFSREIRLYKTPPILVVDPGTPTFEGQPKGYATLYNDGDADFKAIAEAYLAQNPGMELVNFFKSGYEELVVNLPNPNGLATDDKLNVNVITSVDELAFRHGKNDTNPLAAIGVTETKHGYPLLGIRGGDVTRVNNRIVRFASGLYGFTPGGAVFIRSPNHPERNKSIEDPVGYCLHTEFVEELGHFPHEVEVIGVFEAYEPGPQGIKIGARVKTEATYRELFEANREARIIRTDMTNANKGEDKRALEKAIKEELSRRELPEEAWEHDYLMVLPKDPRGIRDFLERNRPMFCGIGAGMLELYTHWREIND